MTTTPSRGLSMVVAYKIGKAAMELLAVIAVLVVHATVGTDVDALSARIKHHWLHGIGAALAGLLRLMARGDQRLILVALAGDALTSALEGWLLWRGFRAARWVVLGATALPLPWELVHLLRQPSAARLVLLLVNVAILGSVWRAGPAAKRVSV